MYNSIVLEITWRKTKFWSCVCSVSVLILQETQLIWKILYRPCACRFNVRPSHMIQQHVSAEQYRTVIGGVSQCAERVGRTHEHYCFA